MPNSVDKVYSSAFLELLEEKYAGTSAESQEGYNVVMKELSAVNDILTGAPELISFSLIPTVSKEDKVNLIKNIFDGKVSMETLNFLCVLSEKNRLNRFSGIFRNFKNDFYEKFGITPIVVSTPFALTAQQKAKITEKMQLITGGQVELSERLDKNLIGGIVVDYKGSRLDGSIKTRLEGLKKEIANTVM